MDNIYSDLINEWNSFAIQFENAINERHFKNFQNSFEKGTQCFDKIRLMILAGDNEGFKKIKDKVDKVTKAWLDSSNKVQPWMDEIKDKIQSNKKIKKNDKKLNKVYGYMKSVGNNLRIKVK